MIKNSGSKAVVLSSWRLRDKANHVFDFPKFTLQPGSSVTVHTGKGSDGRHDLYCGSDGYIWDNDGDTAYLKRGDGSLASECSYSGSGSYKIC